MLPEVKREPGPPGCDEPRLQGGGDIAEQPLLLLAR